MNWWAVVFGQLFKQALLGTVSEASDGVWKANPPFGIIRSSADNPTVNSRVYNRLDMAVSRVGTAPDLRRPPCHEVAQHRLSEEGLFVTKRGRLAAVLIHVV